MVCGQLQESILPDWSGHVDYSCVGPSRVACATGYLLKACSVVKLLGIPEIL